jgi:hypothetical protein
MNVPIHARAGRHLGEKLRARRTRVVAALLLVAMAPVLSSAGSDEVSAPPRGDVLSMAQFYTGSVGNVGDFRGTLVCLRCDLKPGPGAMEQCEKEGHRHALSMTTDSMIHPLLAENEKLLTQINSGELHGKQVSMHGVYYPATGAILIDRVSPEK